MSLKVKDKQGNVYTLANESYKDIYDELINKKGDFLRIDRAYVERGTVIINGTILPGITNSESSIKVVPQKYCPRHTVYGTTIYNSAQNDNNKIQSITVSNDGSIYAWIRDSLLYNESFQIIYPLKTD